MVAKEFQRDLISSDVNLSLSSAISFKEYFYTRWLSSVKVKIFYDQYGIYQYKSSHGFKIGFPGTYRFWVGNYASFFLYFSLISVCPSSLFESFLSSRQYYSGWFERNGFWASAPELFNTHETIFPPPPLDDLDTKHFFEFSLSLFNFRFPHSS